MVAPEPAHASRLGDDGLCGAFMATGSQVAGGAGLGRRFFAALAPLASWVTGGEGWGRGARPV